MTFYSAKKKRSNNTVQQLELNHTKLYEQSFSVSSLLMPFLCQLIPLLTKQPLFQARNSLHWHSMLLYEGI